MIEFHNVIKRYPGGHDALRDVSFALSQGEMAFLTGHSGAGKSTLLKLIALIERASQGQIIINNKNLARLRRGDVPYLRREIGIIFQNYKLLNDRSVFDNVALPLAITGETNARETAKRVRAALDKVGLLGKERAFPLALSGGEQQRVGFARAIVHRPPILLADEPTGNLDPELSRELMALFVQFSEVGVTVLIASHDAELITRTGKRVLSLQHGRLVSDQAVRVAS